MLYLDLDQFKVVNDTFGHAAGDALLQRIAELVHSKIRSTDILARLSGDEFGILLERCSEQRAVDVAEAIRGAIEGFRFDWQESFTTVRCSIGVVMVTAKTTRSRADEFGRRRLLLGERHGSQPDSPLPGQRRGDASRRNEVGVAHQQRGGR